MKSKLIEKIVKRKLLNKSNAWCEGKPCVSYIGETKCSKNK